MRALSGVRSSSVPRRPGLLFRPMCVTRPALAQRSPLVRLPQLPSAQHVTPTQAPLWLFQPA